MFSKSSIGLKYLCLLIIINLIIAIIRTETILYCLHPEMINVVRTTAYISVFITGLFSFILILLAFYILYMFNKKDKNLVNSFTYGLQYFSIALIAGEVLKLLQVFILLKDELAYVDVHNLAEGIRQTYWYKMQYATNIIVLAGGVIAFAATVKNKSQIKFSFKMYAQLTIPLFILLAFASGIKL